MLRDTNQEQKLRHLIDILCIPSPIFYFFIITIHTEQIVCVCVYISAT